uniref:Uncharacterized protein n=1 Tax=Anopheles farauti TaxID=69004 RepID=A0A1Y9HB52_9DIPT
MSATPFNHHKPPGVVIHTIGAKDDDDGALFGLHDERSHRECYTKEKNTQCRKNGIKMRLSDLRRTTLDFNGRTTDDVQYSI